MWKCDGKEMLLEDELGDKNKMKIHETVSSTAQQIVDHRDGRGIKS